MGGFDRGCRRCGHHCMRGTRHTCTTGQDRLSVSRPAGTRTKPPKSQTLIIRERPRGGGGGGPLPPDLQVPSTEFCTVILVMWWLTVLVMGGLWFWLWVALVLVAHGLIPTLSRGRVR